MEDIRQQEGEKGMFKRGELPGWFIAKKLFGWSDKRYDEKYWGKLERNWRWWKEEWAKKKRTLETIQEEEKEIKQKKSEIRKWTEEDKDKMDNIVDPNYEL